MHGIDVPVHFPRVTDTARPVELPHIGLRRQRNRGNRKTNELDRQRFVDVTIAGVISI